MSVLRPLPRWCSRSIFGAVAQKLWDARRIAVSYRAKQDLAIFAPLSKAVHIRREPAVESGHRSSLEEAAQSES